LGGIFIDRGNLMDVTTISILIALVGCFIGLAGWLSGRDKRIAGDAHWRGGVDAKLDNISSGINGVCAEVKAVQRTLSEHGERLSTVETSAKQAHHRIDGITKGN
jgi:outer membrane murein-binding lipoprotein Lpp